MTFPIKFWKTHSKYISTNSWCQFHILLKFNSPCFGLILKLLNLSKPIWIRNLIIENGGKFHSVKPFCYSVVRFWINLNWTFEQDHHVLKKKDKVLEAHFDLPIALALQRGSFQDEKKFFILSFYIGPAEMP